MKVYLVEQGSFNESWPVRVFADRDNALVFIESEKVRISAETEDTGRFGPAEWDEPETYESFGHETTQWYCPNHGDGLYLSEWEVQ